MKHQSNKVNRDISAEGLGLSDHQKEELRAVRGELRKLNCSSTDHAFEYGRWLAEAKALLPNKRFSGWVKDAIGINVKTARNYISVHENLSPHRQRLVDAGVILADAKKCVPDAYIKPD